MEELKRKLPDLIRSETKPEMPRMLRWKARFLGDKILRDFLWEYYAEEARKRSPYYLPYIFMKEHFEYLRRYGEIPKRQISMILIDDDDLRTDYFLYAFLEELNYLTIITGRIEYFIGLQERAFQELGLLIELVLPWEEKCLQGNLVWDFTERIQRADCYPEGSICFLPHKKEWKIQDLVNTVPNVCAIGLKQVEAEGVCLTPEMAECFLAAKNFPFRKGRCEELRQWCKIRNWKVKLVAEKPKNLDI